MASVGRLRVWLSLTLNPAFGAIFKQNQDFIQQNLELTQSRKTTHDPLPMSLFRVRSCAIYPSVPVWSVPCQSATTPKASLLFVKKTFYKVRPKPQCFKSHRAISLKADAILTVRGSTTRTFYKIRTLSKLKYLYDSV